MKTLHITTIGLALPVDRIMSLNQFISTIETKYVSSNLYHFTSRKFRQFKWLYHCSKTEERRMYEPWDGCVWIHSNRVLTYHLLHWQRAMMDNPIIFYYTVAPLPPPQKYTSQMSNIRYFSMKVSKSNI